jgi:putative CocE/NonD family hydrolase
MHYDALSYINIRIPMRDGVELAADLYLPAEPVPTPRATILSFSPYLATSTRDGGSLTWVRRGFAGLRVDCRGRGQSGGAFVPWTTDIDDAWDLLEWISRQPWSNGRVGMVGGSYPAATQLAALCSGHPALAAAAPSAITADPYSHYYTGGAQELSFMMSWHIGICTPATPPTGAPRPDFPAVRQHLPLARLADFAGLSCPSWEAIAANDWYSDYWRRQADPRDMRRSRAGLFYQGSWFDLLGEQTFEAFARFMEGVDPNDTTSNRRFTCLRVGPWGHGVNTPEGDYTFGKHSLVTEDAEIDFLTSLLNGGTPQTASNPAPIQIFVMGRNVWRFEHEWPLARTRYTPLYLAGGGAANTATGDGRLNWEAPAGDEPPDHFTYDPANPVPTCGGRIVGNGGQRDQSEIEARPDVLVYTTAPLTGDLEVTGPVRMRLYAASSAPDTDFTVKLVDLHPDGRPMNVCDGILRVRFRDGLDQPGRLMTPGETVALDIDVDVTSYCFLKGHALRVEISSSNFPHYARNPNTGTPVATETRLQKAGQTVFHSIRHPSHLLLPVIPADRPSDPKV